MFPFASLRRFCGAALAALALAVPVVSRAQSYYTIIDLGTLGGAFSQGNAINNSGQVAGIADLPGGTSPNYHAVRWTGSVITDLGAAFNDVSYASAINDSGQVAGQAPNGVTGFAQAFRWTGNIAEDLVMLGQHSSANGINASGQITGNFGLWTGTTLEALNAPGGNYSSGYAINDSGQVAGGTFAAGGVSLNAVRWTGTTSEILAAPGGNPAVGYGVNASGQVAGCSFTASGSYHRAIRWTGTVAEDLGTLGGIASAAYAINRSGEVVGFSDITDDDTFFILYRAFLYTGGRMVDLNTLLPPDSGWILLTATGINDKGWITGQGMAPGPNPGELLSHAYLLTPVPVAAQGRIALEGVPDLSAIPPVSLVGAFRLSFRIPGTLTEVYGANVSVIAKQGSPFGTFSLIDVPAGVYDVAIKSAKNLRVILPGVTVNAGSTLPDVTLPAGDANNDNSVDGTDFGILIGAYGGDASAPGSGYDATADFNFDGLVDSADFGLLMGEYNAAGAP